MMFNNYPCIGDFDLSQVDEETKTFAKSKFNAILDSVLSFTDKDGIFSVWTSNQSLFNSIEYDADGKLIDTYVRDAGVAALLGSWIFQKRTESRDEGFLYTLPYLEQAVDAHRLENVPKLFNELDTYFIQMSVGLGCTFAAVLFPGLVDISRRGLLDGARGRNPDDGLTSIAGWLAQTVGAAKGICGADSYDILSRTVGYFKSSYPFISSTH